MFIRQVQNSSKSNMKDIVFLYKRTLFVGKEP